MSKAFPKDLNVSNFWRTLKTNAGLFFTYVASTSGVNCVNKDMLKSTHSVIGG